MFNLLSPGHALGRTDCPIIETSRQISRNDLSSPRHAFTKLAAEEKAAQSVVSSLISISIGTELRGNLATHHRFPRDNNSTPQRPAYAPGADGSTSRLKRRRRTGTGLARREASATSGKLSETVRCGDGVILPLSIRLPHPPPTPVFRARPAGEGQIAPSPASSARLRITECPNRWCVSRAWSDQYVTRDCEVIVRVGPMLDPSKAHSLRQ